MRAVNFHAVESGPLAGAPGGCGKGCDGLRIRAFVIASGMMVSNVIS